MISYDIIWYMISYDIWYHMISYNIICYHMISYRHHMISYDIIWHHMISYDITWYHMIMISYDIIWYHLISHDVIWYHMISYDIIWYHKKSHDIIWHHMTSCDIIWYHMISHDIIWYHISRGRGCRRGRGLAMQTRQESFFMNFTLKIKKCKKKSAIKFCTCSLLNHCKIFFLEPVSTTFYFQGKLIFCERARNSCEHTPFCCRVVNLERSNTAKTHTKWPLIFVPAPSVPSTGP